jgi:cyclase
MQALRVEPTEEIPSGYEVYIDGARVATGLDALQWARRAEGLGAGEICVNSIDADGTAEGYELTVTRMISEAVGIPVIASGGAGRPEHLHQVLTDGKADAALIASMVHYGTYPIGEIKSYLHQGGVPVRMRW